MNSDVLVIGTGISGIAFSIKLALKSPQTEIILISKTNLMEGNTRYAQGGIAVVSDFKKDSYKKHINDTLIAGSGNCNKKVVQFVVKEAQERIRELISWGTEFDTFNNELDLAKEAGHSENRIVHYKDQTGEEIQKKLIERVKSFSNIKIFENHTLVDLITDHHTKSNFKRCYGAYVVSEEKEEIIKITARTTILSTGGAGSIYAHTTNPDIATGDGLGAAYRAKVYIEKLPFVQFHPTALFPKINNKTFLISEALRGAGALLRNSEGKRFMIEYDIRAELAPRDIVSRAIQMEIQKSKINYVYLDCKSITSEKWLKHFPNIYEKCKSIGINLPNELIPIVPAAHYFCGGIKVNSNGESSLKGLYAVGECSSTGLHGANRLASNSLLESLVFSHRAALEVIKSLSIQKVENNFYESIPEWKGERYASREIIESIIGLREKIQITMTEKVGIFKSNKSLIEAEYIISKIHKEVVLIYSKNKLTQKLSEIRNMVSISYLLIKQAQQIKINKGVFYNKNNEIFLSSVSK
jgi:L-aspartate oxidase